MPAHKSKRGRPLKTAHRKPGKFEEQNTPVDPVQEFQENPEDLLREILGVDYGFVPMAEVSSNGNIQQIPNDLDNVSPALLEKLHIDSRVTPLKICALFPRCRFQERTIRNIMTDAGLFAIKGEGYELIPAITVLLLHFQRLAEGKKKELHPDTEREKKANADTAVLKAMELAKSIVPKEAALQYWSDARIELRKVIETADYLKPEQREKLLREFQGLKTKLEI